MPLFRLTRGRLLALALLLAIGAQSDLWRASILNPAEENPLLAPCSRFDAVYDHLPFTTLNFDEWPELYHDKVASVVEEYIQGLNSTAKCDASTSEEFLVPGEKLKALAMTLPTWRRSSSPARPLRSSDVGLVLLEYLRAYECAMFERAYFLPRDSLEILQSSSAGESTYPGLTQEMDRERHAIETEVALSRTALNRTLMLLGSINRLLPLDAELQCVERASLDIRNAAALAAEASACLPRIWNAKDPLRDLVE